MATAYKTFKNPDRISVREYADDFGVETISELIVEYADESSVPAMCRHGCEVEPDGRCEHGCPSLLLAVGVI